MNNSKKGPPLPPRPQIQEDTVISPPPPSDLPPPFPPRPLSQENSDIPPPSDLPPIPPQKNDKTNEALNKRNSILRPGGEIKIKLSETPLKDKNFDDKQKPKNKERQKKELQKQKGHTNLKKLVNFFERTKDEPQNSIAQLTKNPPEIKQSPPQKKSITKRFKGFIYGKSKTDQTKKPVKIFRILEEIPRRF